MRKKFLSKRSAITLVELIIAVTIITFVFAAATAMIITSMKLFKAELSESITTDDLTAALEWIKKDAIMSDLCTIVGNTVTLSFTDPSNNPLPGIRYYVKNATELYRQILGVGGSEKMITDLIDASKLPIFTQPEDSNYLFAEIWIRDTVEDVSAGQDVGVMLRCRSN